MEKLNKITLDGNGEYNLRKDHILIKVNKLNEVYGEDFIQYRVKITKDSTLKTYITKIDDSKYTSSNNDQFIARRLVEQLLEKERVKNV